MTLVDYDLILQVGEPVWCVGTPMYSAPDLVVGRPAEFSQDVFSLAASLFHVLFDREPFRHDGNIRHDLGLNWDAIDKKQWGWLPDFFELATNHDSSMRFPSAIEAAAWLRRQGSNDRPPIGESTSSQGATAAEVIATDDAPPTGPQHVPWLEDLLATYPGSPRGTIETRGLDSDFAHNTYVPTALEDKLFAEVQRREAQLVILCGNAGDGKTAFLQHLASRLGLPRRQSSERVWESRLADGLRVLINLDGAASFKEKTSDQLLDDVFSPFHDGPAGDARVHLVAVNDGRLLQWAEEYEDRIGKSTLLTQWIYDTLLNDNPQLAPHIRLINLNARSLVGTFKPGAPAISTEFLDNLLDKLLGGDKKDEIWSPCRVCSAARRCTVNQSVHLLLDKSSQNAERMRRIRERLAEALQAVHHRGQVHITTRELRGALTYIFFGIHYCDDLHKTPDLAPTGYWDRAFDPDAPQRQGEVLMELRRFDPALESHPLIDRYLRSSIAVDDGTMPPRYRNLELPSARRRAYFEWTEQDVLRVGQHKDAHGLTKGSHLQLFAKLPSMSTGERAEV